MLEFSLKGKGFNLQNAYNCCLLSKAAYLPKELIAHQLIEEFGMSEVKKFSNLNCKGFIASSEQVTVISFTGSEFDFDTWQENIDALFSPGPFGSNDRVHRGFNLGISQIKDDLITKIKITQNKKRPLFITGHSLGGAIANIFAAHLLHEELKPYSIYTYGAPRVGCKKFKQLYNYISKGISFRIVNRHDIVPRTPPRLSTFDHVGELHYIDPSGAIQKGISAWRRLLMYLDPSGKTPKAHIKEIIKRLPNAIDDHSLENYLERINQALKNQEVHN
ncbi:MAG: hypothetical protein CMO46_13075 [Verrucomicrobiales bacterium]|nr:hypothetical protein [Verrucomicrobiales bacterium]|tara:strand:+ start:7868 stop:8695 length:828 start_codon:yes stop_codon:yes gene_type:complete